MAEHCGWWQGIFEDHIVYFPLLLEKTETVIHPDGRTLNSFLLPLPSVTMPSSMAYKKSHFSLTIIQLRKNYYDYFRNEENEM